MKPATFAVLVAIPVASMVGPWLFLDHHWPLWTAVPICAAIIAAFALVPHRPRRSLVDLTVRAVARDPGDAPTVCLEADIMADDMERYAPTALEP